jgi:hypothetical protein
MNALDAARLGLSSMEHWYGLPEALFADRTIQDYRRTITTAMSSIGLERQGDSGNRRRPRGVRSGMRL